MARRESATRNVIRWAIGSPEGRAVPRGAFWGNEKGDIYVAVRCLGGIAKASFHRDGKCQVGFTDNYAATASRRFAVESRHWERWRLPADPVVRILQVVVPHSELSSFHDRDDRDITWLPSPPEGSVSLASVFVSEQGMQLEGPPDGVTLVGTVRTSIRTAWLVYSYHPIAEGTAKLLDDERMKLRGKLEAEGVRRCPGRC